MYTLTGASRRFVHLSSVHIYQFTFPVVKGTLGGLFGAKYQGFIAVPDNL